MLAAKLRPAYITTNMAPPATPPLLTVQLKWQAKPLVGIDLTFPVWLSAG
jgi:hypothetical protein